MFSRLLKPTARPHIGTENSREPRAFAGTILIVELDLEDVKSVTQSEALERHRSCQSMDVYFSADVETDGPIPGPYSLLSFALVYAGCFDGEAFHAPAGYGEHFYQELQPISGNFENEALAVNGLDRARLCVEGTPPRLAMTLASKWVRRIAGRQRPVLVAYPLSFDWSWLYWYFVQFSEHGSPFDYSSCFDIKTAVAVKAGIPISKASRSKLFPFLRSRHEHTHHAVDDAIAQAEIFANVFSWGGQSGPTVR